MDISTGVVSSSLGELTNHYRVITHNLANSNTAGYKRRVIARTLVEPAGTAAESDLTSGSLTSTTVVDFAQGTVIRTGRSLDVALDGDAAFFVIETPDGPLYTRNGVFRLNAQGQVVDASGHTVSGEGGPIVIPPGTSTPSIHVSRDGQIGASGTVVGKLRVVQFDDPSQLTPAGPCCFQAPPTVAPTPAAEVVVHQGFQEASNVKAVEELVNLIMVTRLYEANIKSIQAQDERLENILQVAMA